MYNIEVVFTVFLNIAPLTHLLLNIGFNEYVYACTVLYAIK